MHAQNTKYLLFSYGNNGRANASQYYVVSKLHLLLQCECTDTKEVMQYFCSNFANPNIQIVILNIV